METSEILYHTLWVAGLLFLFKEISNGFIPRQLLYLLKVSELLHETNLCQVTDVL